MRKPRVSPEKGNTFATFARRRGWGSGTPCSLWPSGLMIRLLYLAELFAADLTEDDYYAIDEHGSPYDDDIGGPAYVGGQDEVKLDPLSPEQDAAARLAAERLFREIEPTSDR